MRQAPTFFIEGAKKGEKFTKPSLDFFGVLRYN